MRDTDVLQTLLLDPTHELAWRKYRALGPVEAAQLFARCAFTGSVAEALIERNWLLASGEKFSQTLAEAFAGELRPAAFMITHLRGAQIDELLGIEKNSEKILAAIVVSVTHDSAEFFRAFARAAALEMYNLSTQRYLLLRNSIYRTFDILDDVLGLDYHQDREMNFDGRGGERVFAGAGLGVQSSYLSLFIGLRELARKNARIVDLGSGYGRVGLIAGLLFPECSFTGYELVGHRVKVAEAAARQLGLSPRVEFVEQDLSTFSIPEADAYYLYDPFTPETYEIVLSQLNQIASRKPTQVIAKGGALAKLRSQFTNDSHWGTPQLMDEDTLGMFQT